MTRHSDSSEVFFELYPLVIASLTGEITSAQVAQLEELVGSDPQARRLYSQLICESVNLRTWAESAGEQTSDEATMPGSVARRRRRSMAVRWASAVVATSLLVCLLVGWIFMSSSENESVTLSNQELERETTAVVKEAQAVLDLLDELEQENETIVRLLDQDAGDEPIGDSDEREPA